MARIAGITIEKDKQGNARYARIDLKKYGHLLNPIFKELGIEDEVSHYKVKTNTDIPNSTTVKAMKAAKEGKVIHSKNSTDMFTSFNK